MKQIGSFGKAWIVVVFAYSVARAIIVWPTLGHYGVNPLTFFVIDVGTAFPYALAQVKVVIFVRNRNLASLQAWLAVLAVTFIAPYWYIVWAGENMPLYVYMVIGTIAAAFAAVCAFRVYKGVQSKG